MELPAEHRIQQIPKAEQHPANYPSEHSTSLGDFYYKQVTQNLFSLTLLLTQNHITLSGRSPDTKLIHWLAHRPSVGGTVNRTAGYATSPYLPGGSMAAGFLPG